MIRVLVVDDSATVRQRLIEILVAAPDVEVVGQAGDGRRACELVAALRPDVVTLDIVMPDMTGLAATEVIMAHHPTPILIVSSSFNRGELFDTYSALAAGAVDVLEKPHATDTGEWDVRFVEAVRLVAKIKVITHLRGRREPATTPSRGREVGREIGRVYGAAPSLDRKPQVVAIGASTGGPGAIVRVLAGIAPGFPLPIVVLLHIDARFADAFGEWLGSQTSHPVRFAVRGELVDGAAGTVLVAPAERHLVIRDRRVELVDAPPRNHCRPSIDVLFESIALDYGRNAAACLLTGMGRDGAEGLLAIRAAGGMTLGQDEATSVIYGMPREAAARGAVERELPLDEIGIALDQLRLRKEVP